MAKIPFNHDIDEEVAASFDDLARELGLFKCRLLEAAIQTFVALPQDLQYRLISANPENRELCLKLLGGLVLSSEPKKHAQQAKPSKRA